MKKKIELLDIFVYTILILLVVVIIMPLLLAFIVSISDEKSVVLNGYLFFPEKYSLEAYRYIINDASWVLRSYLNTTIVVVIGTALSMIITSMLAYAFSVKKFK